MTRQKKKKKKKRPDHTRKGYFFFLLDIKHNLNFKLAMFIHGASDNLKHLFYFLFLEYMILDREFARYPLFHLYLYYYLRGFSCLEF